MSATRGFSRPVWTNLADRQENAIACEGILITRVPELFGVYQQVNAPLACPASFAPRPGEDWSSLDMKTCFAGHPLLPEQTPLDDHLLFALSVSLELLDRESRAERFHTSRRVTVAGRSSARKGVWFPSTAKTVGAVAHAQEDGEGSLRSRAVADQEERWTFRIRFTHSPAHTFGTNHYEHPFPSFVCLQRLFRLSRVTLVSRRLWLANRTIPECGGKCRSRRLRTSRKLGVARNSSQRTSRSRRGDRTMYGYNDLLNVDSHGCALPQ